MYRVIDLAPDGTASERAGEQWLAVPTDGVVRWVDVTSPDGAELELLRQGFALDPLAIADCSKYDRQPKVDEYERYLFVVIHAFTPDEADPLEIKIHEVHAFLGENYLITVHDGALPALGVLSKPSNTGHVLARGPSWALYLAVEAMVKMCDPLVEKLIDELDDAERKVIEDGEAVEIGSVFRIKRHAVSMRRVLRPLRDTLRLLHRRTDGRVSPRAALHFRDLADHVQLQADTIEDAREVAVGVVASYQALLGTRTNEVVKRLTLFSAVFLPLGFIVGFWGQNFTGLPFGDTWALVLMLVSLVVVPIALLEWFRRNWL